MSKDKISKKHKIIFVNSFKGGTGKTSISLSLCVTAALSNQKKKQYDKIYYFDIDVLGTGSYYKLFTEGMDSKYFFDNYDKDSWSDFSRKIEVGKDETKATFYALCINPNLRIKKNNYENTVLKTNSVSEQIFIGSVYHFINESSNTAMDNPSLYIIDCSPGFNRIERELISRLRVCEGFDVKETFVTTYDSSHVEKTVECLKQYFSTCEIKEKRYIILNDIHNLENIKTEDNESISLNFNSAKEAIKRLFNREENKLKYEDLYDIYEMKYMDKILHSNLLTRKVGLESSYDDYNIVSNLFKEVVRDECIGE